MAEKRYPFSASKHAHSIEYYKNHLFCVMCDMESGEIPMDKKRYDRMHDMYYGELRELLNEMVGGAPMVYLNGKQIALAKKIVVWASESRANKLIEAGKYEYLQYC